MVTYRLLNEVFSLPGQDKVREHFLISLSSTVWYNCAKNGDDSATNSGAIAGLFCKELLTPHEINFHPVSFSTIAQIVKL